MDYLFALAADPSAWLAFVTLVAMEIVLGVDYSRDVDRRRIWLSFSQGLHLRRDAWWGLNAFETAPSEMVCERRRNLFDLFQMREMKV